MQRRGLGLVEVLAASASVAVVAMGFLAALRYGADSVEVAKRESGALTLAQNQIDRLRMEAVLGSVPLGRATMTAALPNVGQSATVSATATPVAGTQLLVDVDVLVTYPMPRTGTGTVRLATRMRNGGGP